MCMLARGYIGWEDGWRCKAQQQLLLCSALLLLLVNRVLSEPVQAAILVEPTTVRIQETTTQAVGVSIAGQVVAVSARGAGTEAPRKHTRRKSLAENMVHRPRLEGIGARPIDESFGRRQPATPPHAQRRCKRYHIPGLTACEACTRPLHTRVFEKSLRQCDSGLLPVGSNQQ